MAYGNSGIKSSMARKPGRTESTLSGRSRGGVSKSKQRTRVDAKTARLSVVFDQLFGDKKIPKEITRSISAAIAKAPTLKPNSEAPNAVHLMIPTAEMQKELNLAYKGAMDIVVRGAAGVRYGNHSVSNAKHQLLFPSLDMQKELDLAFIGAMDLLGEIKNKGGVNRGQGGGSSCDRNRRTRPGLAAVRREKALTSTAVKLDEQLTAGIDGRESKDSAMPSALTTGPAELSIPNADLKLTAAKFPLIFPTVDMQKELDSAHAGAIGVLGDRGHERGRRPESIAEQSYVELVSHIREIREKGKRLHLDVLQLRSYAGTFKNRRSTPTPFFIHC